MQQNENKIAYDRKTSENLNEQQISFRLLYTYKQFCSRFGALVEHVPDLKQLLKDVL